MEAQEKQLFEEWSQRREGFCPDGIIQTKAYLAAPRRILFVLKEPNNKDREAVNIKEFVQNGARRKPTWDNLARWTTGLLHLEENFSWQDLENITAEKKKALLAQVAFMNIKKFAGGHTADGKVIWDFGRQDQDLLRRQFLLYQPDWIIACSKTVDGVMRNLVLPPGFSSYQTHNGIAYSCLPDGGRYISFLHPAARVADNLLYYGLIDAAKYIMQYST